jgi:hypothetical protein
MHIDMIRKLKTHLSRQRADENGLAMVEFALIAPVLIAGLVGALELSQYAIANQRVSQIAMLVADNAARVRDSIDEIDVNEIMTGGKLVGETIGFSANGRIILSSVENNPGNTGQWIRWQRCAGAKNVTSDYGGQGKGQNDATLPAIGPTGNKVSASAGQALMFVEIKYDYQPIAFQWLLGDRTISYMTAMNVRQRNDQAINNQSNLTANKTSSCAYFTA